MSNFHLNCRHCSNPKNNCSSIDLFCEEIRAVSFFAIGCLTTRIDDVTLIESFLFNGQHKLLEEQRTRSTRPKITDFLLNGKIKAQVLQKIFINSSQKQISWSYWQSIQNFFLNLSISILLLLPYLLIMCTHSLQNSSCNSYLLQPYNNFTFELLPIKIILEQADQKSNDFIHQIPEDKRVSDICKDTVDSLKWIFGNNITIGDSADDSYTVIHDIDVDIRPLKEENHLRECLGVVDPADVWGVRSVVVVLVDPQTHQIEAQTHEMGVDIYCHCDFKAEVNSCKCDIQLGYPLKLSIYLFYRCHFCKPNYFQNIRQQRFYQYWHQDCKNGQNINPKFPLYIKFRNTLYIFDQQSITVKCFQWRYQYIYNQRRNDGTMKPQGIVELILPERLSE